jgi:hypothetical protein
MNERRQGERFAVSFPIRVKWRDDDGREIAEEGLTENIGPTGTLIYLPRQLPNVGSRVSLTVVENPEDEVTVIAEVIRLERNAAHPQAALTLLEGLRAWKKKVWECAAEVAAAASLEEAEDW